MIATSCRTDRRCYRSRGARDDEACDRRSNAPRSGVACWMHRPAPDDGGMQRIRAAAENGADAATTAETPRTAADRDAHLCIRSQDGRRDRNPAGHARASRRHPPGHRAPVQSRFRRGRSRKPRRRPLVARRRHQDRPADAVRAARRAGGGPGDQRRRAAGLLLSEGGQGREPYRHNLPDRHR